MPRPSIVLWLVVLAAGCGVLYADIRSEWQSYEVTELDALRARVTLAERRIADCAPRVVAEVPR